MSKLNTDMIGRFLKGEFDPEYRRVKALERLVVAKLNKPETVKVKVDSDWAFPTERRAYSASVKMADLVKTKLAKGVMMGNNGRFSAQITCFGRCMYLGTYDTEALAAQEYRKAKDLIAKGEFTYNGELIGKAKNNKIMELPKFLYYHKNKGRYVIQKRVDGKSAYFGSFAVLEEAIDKLTELGFVE